MCTRCTAAILHGREYVYCMHADFVSAVQRAGFENVDDVKEIVMWRGVYRSRPTPITSGDAGSLY